MMADVLHAVSSVGSQISDAVRQNISDINSVRYGQVIMYIQDGRVVRCEIVISKMIGGQKSKGETNER